MDTIYAEHSTSLPLRWIPSFAEGAAILVTFLWSTSFILIKYGLPQIPPLDFAAYRYGLASLVLLLATSFQRHPSERITRRDVGLLMLMAVTGYTVAQGFQFLGLGLLSTDTTAFFQNMTPVFVLGISYPMVRDRPSRVQLVGLVVTFAGLFSFLLGQPVRAELGGVIIVLVGSVSWALYLVLLRATGISERLGPLRFTAITMSIGSLMLLVSGAFVGGAVSMSLEDWGILAWLAFVNTASAFYLWNVSLKVLTAFEMSILQNTMLVQIALLSWLFLGEGISLSMGIGMLFILSGSGLVQLPELMPAKFGRNRREVLKG